MRKFLLFLFLALPALETVAQRRVALKGKVVDARFHQPLPDALVQISGTDNYTTTTSTGTFDFVVLVMENCTLEISYPNCITQQYTLTLTPDQPLDLGTVLLEEDPTLQQPFGLIQLTENEIEEEDNQVEGSASLLQATKDPFQQAAAYSWSAGFYRLRGLDNSYSKTLLNGLITNQLYHRRPEWNHWGGLNDVTRNQVFTSGSAPSPLGFGGILGTQTIDTRTSLLRPGKRLGFSSSNTSYRWRSFATYASGMHSNHWAYAVSASYRGAKEGYWPGSNYAASSFFIGLEKKLNPRHSFNFTGIYAKNKRGKNSANTQEQTDLKGVRYNAYWGEQEGEKRNARYKEVAEPLLMLTHYWEINPTTSLTTTLGYQWGHQANSRLDYQDNLNPDPTYYKNMPSYYLNQIDEAYWSLSPDEFQSLAEEDPFKQATVASLHQAEEAQLNFREQGQVDWTALYRMNHPVNGQSKIILYEDRQQNQTQAVTSHLHTALSPHLTLDAGIRYRSLQSSNFKKAVDLLGGSYFKDIDTYQEEGFRDSDLQHPNRDIHKGDTYGYQYQILGEEAEAFTLFTYQQQQLTLYIAEQLQFTTYQRDGKYQHPLFVSTSLGKSEPISFNSLGIKGGITYYFSGKHIVQANFAFYNQPPTLQNTFIHPRMNNQNIPDLRQETVYSVDGSYHLRLSSLQVKLTGYWATILHGTQLNTYYTEGLRLTDSKGMMVTELLSNLDKRHLGLELGLAYQLSPSWKISAAAGIGQAFYSRDPQLQLAAIPLAQLVNYGQAKLTNYRLANGPQTALSLDLTYRAPSFWFIGGNFNYLADSFIQFNALKRTQNFILDPEKINHPFDDLTPERLHQVLPQEKLPAYALVALHGGKSWRLVNRTILGFFVSIQNLLNTTYQTGGFEQGRHANYAEEIARSKGGHPLFGNKYWYGYGRNFFIQVYYNF